MMSKHVLFILFLCFWGTAFSLAQGKYCLKYSDYMNDNWSVSDSLHIEVREQGQKFWSGGADFKPVTGDKMIDKQLKKEVGFVVCNDTLYVNCRSLRYQRCRFGNWYAPGFRYGDDKICFICTKIGRKENIKTATLGSLFGAIGGAITAANQLENKACYLLGSDDKTVIRINEKYMEGVLKDNPVLLKKYNSLEENQRESADIVILFFREMNLLSKY